ncbi:hypothetical protein JCM4914_28960 [Streptomyces platensis subsp. malvinus]
MARVEPPAHRAPIRSSVSNGFLTVVFAAHEWTGEPENREPRKHDHVCWVDADALPEEFVDTTASALRRYLADGEQVSLDGWR